MFNRPYGTGNALPGPREKIAIFLGGGLEIGQRV